MDLKPRIAVGGFQHETNTFAPSPATLEAFSRGGAWPPFASGDAMLAGLAGANLPATGAIRTLTQAGFAIEPLAWAAASPSARVTDEAFETIAGAILSALKAAIDPSLHTSNGPLAGVYLDLHGAMVTESYDDGEGELLRRVRSIVGPEVPVVASIDWHANVSEAMVELSDGLVGYRTYPHIDMAQTGERAARLLCQLIEHRRRGLPAAPKVLKRFDWLIPLPAQCSTIEPNRALFAFLEELERCEGVTLTLAPGFPMADISDCGMSVIALGACSDGMATGLVKTLAETESAAEQLAQRVRDSEAHFAMRLYSPKEAVARAIEVGRPGRPVVLADTQDNPGAGGNGDTTGLLSALIEARAEQAVFGLLIDAESAAQAHAAGIGAIEPFALGEQSGLPDHHPLMGNFKIEALSDGKFTCTGRMFTGFKMNLGPMARLRSIDAPGVTVLLASNKCQTADQDMMRVLGIEPAEQAIVALKSSVHFRADFEPIAGEVLIVRAPGPALADPADFPWKYLRPGMRLSPLGPVFEPGLSPRSLNPIGS
jgi:microcystin degradation protein MlrC